MVTVNKRVGLPQALSVNGVDAGGLMTARMNIGYDELLQSAPDGLQVPLKDKITEFCRGTITSQDWVEFVELLTGTLGTKIFYERKSGEVEATGFVKHTITNPVIHRVVMNFAKGRYGTAAYDFECKAADEAKGIADMWAQLDSQAVPTYITTARGGYRIAAAQFDSAGTPIDLYHVTGFNFELLMNLIKESNDGDIGYTCVDARLDGLRARGSITFQDAAIAVGPPVIIKVQELLTRAKSDLVLTITQSQGAAAKTVTISGVDFDTADSNSDAGANFTEYTLNFEIANDETTQLTLAGDNKIIAIT